MATKNDARAFLKALQRAAKALADAEAIHGSLPDGDWQSIRIDTEHGIMRAARYVRDQIETTERVIVTAACERCNGRGYKLDTGEDCPAPGCEAGRVPPNTPKKVRKPYVPTAQEDNERAEAEASDFCGFGGGL